MRTLHGCIHVAFVRMKTAFHRGIPAIRRHPCTKEAEIGDTGFEPLQQSRRATALPLP